MGGMSGLIPVCRKSPVELCPMGGVSSGGKGFGKELPHKGEAAVGPALILSTGSVPGDSLSVTRYFWWLCSALGTHYPQADSSPHLLYPCSCKASSFPHRGIKQEL